MIFTSFYSSTLFRPFLVPLNLNLMQPVVCSRKMYGEPGMMKYFSLFLLMAFAAGCQQRPGGRKGGGPLDASGADFVKRLDKDGDGKVSAQEFDGPEDHFSQCDKNNDGYLTEDEAPGGPPARGGERR
ncbi:hypothetical protein EGM51_17855 [Verrucomicrobia bacterium S94]|nr:hypothetical protein EGM51_17855 [Verrucomicrobia bacterium S94]